MIRAYQELEAQNLVYSVPKSGYRVKIALPTSRSIPDPTRVDLLSICKEILTYPEYQERLPAGSAHPNIDSPRSKACTPRLAVTAASKRMYRAITSCHPVITS